MILLVNNLARQSWFYYFGFAITENMVGYNIL